MKHNTIFKKMLAAFSAAAVGVSCVGFSAFAADTAAEEFTVPEGSYYTYLQLMSGGETGLSDPSETNSAVFTEDGTYEMSYTYEMGSASIELLLIDSNINAYAFAPEGTSDPIADGTVNMSIDSITLTRAADGTVETVEYGTPSEGAFRTGDDGSSIRYNILNQWTNPAVEDISTALPGEGALEGDILTVTFTITGLGAEVVEEEFEIPEGSYYTFMSVQAGAESLWEATEQNTAIFTEDGTYDMSYTFTQGSASIEACIIDSNINAYAFAPEGSEDPIADGTVNMVIDSVILVRADGTEEVIEYTASEGAFRVGDDGSSIRHNILNQWSSPVTTDIPTTLPGEGAMEGDTLKVTFTITGLTQASGDVLYGDANADGTVSLTDASAILNEYAKVAAGMEATFTEAQFVAADVDGDGSIALSDATKVLGYYAANAAGMNPDINEYFPAAGK